MITTVFEKIHEFDKYVPTNWISIFVTFILLVVLVSILIVIGLI